jgi:hypothetical protein
VGVCVIQAKAPKAGRKSYVLRVLYTFGNEVSNSIEEPKMWQTFTAYGAQVFVAVIAFISIWKEWHEKNKHQQNKSKRVYVFLTVLTALLLTFTLADTHNTRKNAANSENQAALRDVTNAQQIQSLTKQVSDLRSDSRDATTTFTNAFGDMSDKLAYLKSKVTNADLLAELEKTQRELRDTQSKLNTPKPVLIPSIFEPDDNTDTPIVSENIPAPLGSAVTVEFTIKNPSDVTAIKGEISLRICDACQYASEPEGFAKRLGAPDTLRAKEFEHILARTRLEKMTATINRPLLAKQFLFQVSVHCENCTTTEQTMLVNLK